MLINLTKNALKFTAKGEISIKAAYENQSSMLRVSVSDSGQGISAKDTDKLFKAFSKLEQEDGALNQDGVGMGLAICKSIVEKSNGFIEVFS